MGAAVVYAKDLDHMVEFYQALGLTVDEFEQADYAVLTGSNVELSIVQIPENIAERIRIMDPPEVREETPIKLVFLVSSIDQVLQGTDLLGGRTVDGSVRWQFRGYSVQDAIDPEGNVYQLREPL